MIASIWIIDSQVLCLLWLSCNAYAKTIISWLTRSLETVLTRSKQQYHGSWYYTYIGVIYRHVARGDAGDTQRPLAEFHASLGGFLCEK